MIGENYLIPLLRNKELNSIMLQNIYLVKISCILHVIYQKIIFVLEFYLVARKVMMF